MHPELVDTHCHLCSGPLAKNSDQVIQAAGCAGVSRLINVSCTPGEWDDAMALQYRNEGRVWLVIGIHPHDAALATETDYARLGDFWGLPGIVGCGEMGLDYHYDFSPRKVQRTVFARQLRTAAGFDLPIVVHSREAHADVVHILLDNGFAKRRVVFHCFSGNRDEAAELWQHGWWTSFTGIITFDKSREQQQVCVAAAADQLMFETDAPYLSPAPVRKVRPNTPANLVHTVRFAAGLRGQSYESLAAESTANAMRFFGINR